MSNMTNGEVYDKWRGEVQEARARGFVLKERRNERGDLVSREQAWLSIG